MGTYVFLRVGQAGFRSQVMVEANQVACSARRPRLLGVRDLMTMIRFCCL
jgi:hypothetical protein